MLSFGVDLRNFLLGHVVAVTGATGFVGRALVRRLLGAGLPATQLLCLVRDRAKAVRMGIPDVSVRQVDLDDVPALTSILADTDLVMHLAGATRGLRRRDYFVANEGATAGLVAALAQVAPRCGLVHVSSLAAAGPTLDGVGSAAAIEDCRPVSDYGASKLAGERVAVESGLRTVILRPPVIYGPGDEATDLLMRQACAALVPVPRRARPLSAVYIDDVLDALLAAMRDIQTDARALRCCIPLDGPERTDTDALMRVLAAGVGCGPPRLVGVPDVALHAASVAADFWSRARRRPAYFSRDKAKEICAVGWVADPVPAERLLGWTATTTLAQGVAQLRPPA